MKKIYYAILIIFTLLVVSCKDKEEVFVTEIEKRGIIEEMDSLREVADSLLLASWFSLNKSVSSMQEYRSETLIEYYCPDSLIDHFSLVKGRVNRLWTTIDSIQKEVGYNGRAYALLDSAHKLSNVYFDNSLSLDKEGIHTLEKGYSDHVKKYWPYYEIDRAEIWEIRNSFTDEVKELIIDGLVFDISPYIAIYLHDFDSLYVRKYAVSNP